MKFVSHFCRGALALAVLTITPQSALAADLLVSAAISLKEPLIKISHSFEKKHPDTRVIFNFGASGTLATQIMQGAPADVFASAAQDQMDKLRAKKLLDKDSSKCFARNSLVVIVPEKGLIIKSLAQLARYKKVAIGNPETVPAGKYAVEALKSARVYDQLNSGRSLVLTENVRQVLTYVEKSEVEAGIVYSTEAKMSKAVHTALELPAATTEPIIYPIAAIKDSKQLELGRAFVDFVADKEQQLVFKKLGFLAP